MARRRSSLSNGVRQRRILWEESGRCSAFLFIAFRFVCLLKKEVRAGLVLGKATHNAMPHPDLMFRRCFVSTAIIEA